MLITDIFPSDGRPRLVSALSLATTGVHNSDALIALYIKTMTIEHVGDQWVPVDIQTSKVLNADIPADMLAASYRYHGISSEQLAAEGVDDATFKQRVEYTMSQAQFADILLIYGLEFLRKFLLKADTCIQVGENVLDITALDRLVRSGTAVRCMRQETGVTSRDLALACQTVGPGTLASMRRAHGKQEPDLLVPVPEANCTFMLDLFKSWMSVSIPMITPSI